MTETAPLEGPLLKLDRAKEHIKDAKWAVGKFAKRDPYKVSEKTNTETGERVYRVMIKDKDASPPPRLGILAGDAVHNLRAALDLLIRALIVANNKTPQKEAFPISNSEGAFSKGGISRVEGQISSGALDIVRSLKPYKGGNDTLWALNELDIIDKHRLLLVVGGANTALILAATAHPPKGVRGPPLKTETGYRMEKRFPLKDGDELTRMQPLGFAADPGAGKMNVEPKFSFDVVLNEPGVVDGEPLIPTLGHFAGAVAEIIDLFAALPELAPAQD